MLFYLSSGRSLIFFLPEGDRGSLEQFRTACQYRSWKNDQGEYEIRTEWHRVYAWNKLAKFAGTLQKGQLIAIEGTLRYREIEDEAKGTKHRIAEVTPPVSSGSQRSGIVGL